MRDELVNTFFFHLGVRIKFVILHNFNYFQSLKEKKKEGMDDEICLEDESTFENKTKRLTKKSSSKKSSEEKRDEGSKSSSSAGTTPKKKRSKKSNVSQFFDNSRKKKKKSNGEIEKPAIPLPIFGKM